jgi:hypothetical protein
MNAQDRTALMHAVLDGEATPEQGRALMALLVEDAQARAEYDALHALVTELGQLPQRPVPAGFAGRVMAAIEAHQLSVRSRVIDSRSARGWSSWVTETLRQALLPEPTWSGTSMKKIWIGGAVAALAVIAVAQFGFGGKTSDKDTMGTVVPAERHRAAQPSAGDVGVATGTGGTATTAQPATPAAAAQGNAVQGNALQGNALQGNAVQGNALQGNAVQGNAVQGNAVQGNAVQGNALQGNALQGNAVQGGMVQGNAVQGNAVQGGMVQGGMVQGGMVQGGMAQGGMAQGNAVQGNAVQGSQTQGSTANK